MLAAEDPARRVTISAGEGELALFDGRNKAQNGWFVVRGILPGGRTGAVLEWTLKANSQDGLAARTGDRPFAGRLPPGAGEDRGDRTRSRRQATGDGAARSRAPGWFAAGRPGFGGAALGTLQALRIPTLRFFGGARTRRVPARIRRRAERAVSHRGRRLRRHLAADARRVPPGADGSHARQRGLPRLARRVAPGRRATGAGGSRTFRPVRAGSDDGQPVCARRTYPRPQRRRLV